MVGVGYINSRPEHIMASDFDAIAGIDHDITVEVIGIADSNSDTTVLTVFRPKPAPSCQRVQFADFDLSRTPDSYRLHSASIADFHSQRAIEKHSEPAEQTCSLAQQQYFNPPANSSHSRPSRLRIRRARSPARRKPGSPRAMAPLPSWVAASRLRQVREPTPPGQAISRLDLPAWRFSWRSGSINRRGHSLSLGDLPSPRVQPG